jgi:HPt (histidine-containing phosphotransfer) domain-containing protein
MAENEPHGPVLDQSVWQSVVEMIGADEPAVMVDLIDTFLVDSAKQIDELDRSLAGGDFKTLHRMAHSMKSSSATFGAMYLSRLCQSLELSAKEQCADGTCGSKVQAIRLEHAIVVDALHEERARLLMA